MRNTDKMTMLATAPEDAKATEVEAQLARLRDAVTAKEREITEAEAQCASLVAADTELVTAINENRRLAAAPEPQAADFAEVSEWHGALRKWRADGPALDEALAPLEQQRSRMANEQIPAARSRIGALRFEHAQAEFDLAKYEHLIAQSHANELLARVARFQRALGSAGEAARASAGAR